MPPVWTTRTLPFADIQVRLYPPGVLSFTYTALPAGWTCAVVDLRPGPTGSAGSRCSPCWLPTPTPRPLRRTRVVLTAPQNGITRMPTTATPATCYTSVANDPASALHRILTIYRPMPIFIATLPPAF